MPCRSEAQPRQSVNGTVFQSGFSGNFDLVIDPDW